MNDPTMATRLTVTEARANLPALLDRVAAGEEITITRHGDPVATLIRHDRVKVRRAAVESLMAEAADLRRSLEAARHEPLGPPCVTRERADEIVAWIREGRDARG